MHIEKEKNEENKKLNYCSKIEKNKEEQKREKRNFMQFLFNGLGEMAKIIQSAFSGQL